MKALPKLNLKKIIVLVLFFLFLLTFSYGKSSTISCSYDFKVDTTRVVILNQTLKPLTISKDVMELNPRLVRIVDLLFEHNGVKYYIKF